MGASERPGIKSGFFTGQLCDLRPGALTSLDLCFNPRDTRVLMPALQVFAAQKCLALSRCSVNSSCHRLFFYLGKPWC